MIEALMIGAIIIVLLVNHLKGVLRAIQAVVPMEVRTHIEGLNPRAIKVGPIIVPNGTKVDAIILDAKYTVTDAGISAGETFQGLIKTGRIMRGKRLVGEWSRDCLVPAVLALAGTKEEYPQTLDTITNLYSDAMPTTAVEQHSFYTLTGPFGPGKHYVYLQFNAVTDEFGAASVFTADIGVTYLVGAMLPGDRFIDFTSAQKYSALDVTLKEIDGGVLYATIANVDVIKIGGKALSAVAYECLRRTWLMRFNTAWNGTLRANDLGWIFRTKRTVYLTFSTASNLQWVSIRKEGKYFAVPTKKDTTKGKKYKKVGGKFQLFEGDDQTMLDDEDDQQDVDEYEVHEVDPADVRDAWEDPDDDDFDNEEDEFGAW